MYNDLPCHPPAVLVLIVIGMFTVFVLYLNATLKDCDVPSYVPLIDVNLLGSELNKSPFNSALSDTLVILLEPAGLPTKSLYGHGV